MSSHISVVGTVATRPILFASEERASVCSFRLAANERRYNRESQQWEDGTTNWFTVVSFRGLADHAAQSFSVGDRILVTGRLRVRQWSKGEKSGTSVEIDAEAVGHDVRWGVSTFRKRRSSEAANAGGGEPEAPPADADAVPEEQHWLSPETVPAEQRSSDEQHSSDDGALREDGFTPAAA